MYHQFQMQTTKLSQWIHKLKKVIKKAPAHNEIDFNKQFKTLILKNGTNQTICTYYSITESGIVTSIDDKILNISYAHPHLIDKIHKQHVSMFKSGNYDHLF